jgi:putative protein-disulfide isomerase
MLKREEGAGISEMEEMNELTENPGVFVEYYTDPLCSWSWAFEAQWRRLRYECGEHLAWRYHMGGLIPNWQSYDDPFNDIRNPAQMRPQWFQVREFTGMPLDDRIWQIDPPASSYPACITMKAAERQGQVTAESFLRRLREAAMLERRNIARQEVLLEIAEELASKSSSRQDILLDLDRFRDDLAAPETMDAFRQDLRDAAYYNIGRFPALILQRPDGRGIVLVGYRPYEALCAALEHLAPGLRQQSNVSREELAVSYVTHWQSIVARELAEVLEEEAGQASALLESLVAEGVIRKAEDTQSETAIYVPDRER